MRFKAVVSILASTVCTSGVLAADAAPQPLAPPPGPGIKFHPPRIVYLNGAAGLAKLKSENPSHYARAQRILAAADELCRPGAAEVSYARFEARQVSCAGAFYKTSNPAKRQIGFTLDDTRYVALVPVDSAARAVPAR